MRQEQDRESWLRLLKDLDRRGVGYRQGHGLFIHDGSAGAWKRRRVRTRASTVFQREKAVRGAVCLTVGCRGKTGPG